jgi:two-component system, cell cycle response regulator DivK
MKPMSASKPLRVLLVEDYAAARQMFRMGLGYHGYQVEEAESVEEALTIAASKRIDVVVLDLFLVSGSGLEVARVLRERPGPAPLFIALSGHSGDPFRELARSVGCDAYLVKPCMPEKLIETIENLLGKTAQGKTA